MIHAGCDKASLRRAAKIVSNGGTVVYPTDTVYGLGCDPFNQEALSKIQFLKTRVEKPFPILCSDPEQAGRLASLSEDAKALAERFWPGPLTIVTPSRDPRLRPPVKSSNGTVGVRVPRHPCALLLLKLCGGSLVGTSANKTGLKAPTTPTQVLKVLGSGFDILVDGGRTTLGIESTVIDASKHPLILLREGAIKAIEIREVLE